jgi:hypothetical protein
LILDAAGNLYGTTSEGGLTNGCSGAGCGTAFRLSPPTTAGGAWNKATLYVFQGGSDASLPVTELVMDGQHNLYGRSAEGGTGGAGAIFELSPPKTHGPWTEKIIYSVVTPTTPKFISSYNGLVRDRAGALYSTLYGGTSGFGEVFQLVPPSSAGGSWTFNTVYNFQGGSDGVTPVGTLILSPSGKLFGSTLYGGTDGMGTAYQLAPPAQTGGSWTETILYSFTGGSNDGANPDAGLTFGSGGLLYGTTSDGGTDNSRACPSFAPGPGCGTIFSVQP